MGWGEPMGPKCDCEGCSRPTLNSLTADLARADDLVAAAVADRADLEAENERLKAEVARLTADVERLRRLYGRTVLRLSTADDT